MGVYSTDKAAWKAKATLVYQGIEADEAARAKLAAARVKKTGEPAKEVDPDKAEELAMGTFKDMKPDFRRFVEHFWKDASDFGLIDEAPPDATALQNLADDTLEGVEQTAGTGASALAFPGGVSDAAGKGSDGGLLSPVFGSTAAADVAPPEARTGAAPSSTPDGPTGLNHSEFSKHLSDDTASLNSEDLGNLYSGEPGPLATDASTQSEADPRATDKAAPTAPHPGAGEEAAERGADQGAGGALPFGADAAVAASDQGATCSVCSSSAAPDATKQPPVLQSMPSPTSSATPIPLPADQDEGVAGEEASPASAASAHTSHPPAIHDTPNDTSTLPPAISLTAASGRDPRRCPHPECSKPYSMGDTGKPFDYCGRMHAREHLLTLGRPPPRSKPMPCRLPGCKKLGFYDEETDFPRICCSPEHYDLAVDQKHHIPPKKTERVELRCAQPECEQERCGTHEYCSGNCAAMAQMSRSEIQPCKRRPEVMV
jgi:hypothetical protein